MQTNAKNSFVSIFVAIVALFFMAYGFIVRAQSDVSLEPKSPGSDLILLAQRLNSASLSNVIFSSPAYTSLSDFSSPIPAELVGRINPFAELSDK